MLLGGLQKTTLIDFPNRVACTIFTVGCNFRCPFCHNRNLVTKNLFKKSGLKLIKENYLFNFLEKRKKILDGVCITGGEPTVQNDLELFCQRIKKLGFEIKLDTNGSNPHIIKKLLEKKLVNLIAMDIKSTFSDYQKAVGPKFNIRKIKESINLILKSKVEHELRTTVVPGIHNAGNIERLAKELKNIGKKLVVENINYILQPFRPQNCLRKTLNFKKQFSQKEMKDLLNAANKYLPNSKIRGEN